MSGAERIATGVAPAVATVDPADRFERKWVLVPAAQTMHDGTVLKTWGVQAGGIWVGRVHPIGPNPVEQALARRHAALFAASKGMAAVLQEALEAFGDEFDLDMPVDAAELVAWLAAWRVRARAALGKAGAP